MLKRSFLFLFSSISILCFSQQWVELTQQHRYEMYLNPSLAGVDGTITGTVAHRSQYVGLSNRAISTQYVGFSSPIFSNKFGVGLNVVNDQIGYQRFSSGDVTMAYHLALKKTTLSFGLSGGFIQLGLDGSLLRAADGNYTLGTVVHNDNLLPNVKVGGLSPTASSGIALKTGNFIVGVAGQNIISPKINFETPFSGTFTQINRTINTHSSYVIQLNKVKLVPMVFYKTDFVKHQMQGNFLIDFNNIFFGMAFRGYSGFNNDAIAGMFGFRVKKKISLGYSYDYNISGLSNSNSGSHEISVRYENLIKFKEKSTGNIMHNPRFL